MFAENEWNRKNIALAETKGILHETESFFDFCDITINSTVEFTECPDLIEIFIREDVSLIDVHNAIRAKIFFDKKTEVELKKELNYYNSIGDLNNENKINEKIKELKNDEDWKQYKDITMPILNKYITVMSPEMKGIFVTENIETNENIKYRLELINEYLSKVSSLSILKINYCYQYDDIYGCPDCNKQLDENSFCVSCGYFTEISYSLNEQNEFQKIFSITNQTETNVPFFKWLDQYLCVSKEDIPDDMFQKFDEVCINRGWETGEKIRESGKSPDLNLLLTIMQLSGYSTYYKHKNIIRHKYWNWPIPILTEEQKSQIKSDYFLSQNEYSNFCERKQNINLEIRGYYHLKAVGYNISISDLKIPSNLDTIKSANRVWENICNKTGIKCFLV